MSRQSATERREQFEERAEIQQHGREHGQYWDLSSPEKRLAAALIAAANTTTNRSTSSLS